MKLLPVAPPATRDLGVWRVHQKKVSLPASIPSNADMSTEDARPIHIQIEPMPTPDGPFVLADAGRMNMPIFSKPIVAPKMILSQFPKVRLALRRM